MKRKQNGKPNAQRDKAPRKRQSRSSKRGSNAAESIREDDSDVKRTAADNDISWWSKNPEMLKAAASLPFSQSIGTALVVPGNQVVNRKDDTAVPGLMTLNFVPVPGLTTSEGMSAPVNLAATHLYSIIRSRNSGATNYDAPNLMMYLLTMDGVFMYYSYLARLYGLLRLYSQRNRYLPRLLVEANGCDYDDLMANMAQFRYFINQFAVRASSLCVPATMDYFRRHFWITQNVYMDQQTEKAQLYMFVPAAFYQYIGVYNNRPTVALKYPLRDDTKRTLADLITIGNSLLNGVLSDADINIMSGDILKAYTEDKLFRLQPIPEDFLVSPIYSEEVLTQIHNADVLGIPSPEFYTGTESQATWDLNQSAGNCVSEAIVTGTNPTSWVACSMMLADTKYTQSTSLQRFRNGRLWLSSTDRLLNSHYNDVSPENVMIMTRLKAAGIVGFYDGTPTSKPGGVALDSVGTEFIANARVYYASFSRDEQQISTVTFSWEAFCTTLTKAEFAAAHRFLIFQDHPIVTVINSAPTNGETPITVVGFIGDLDNYTFASPEVIRRINEAALLSAFDVPMLGSF